MARVFIFIIIFLKISQKLNSTQGFLCKRTNFKHGYNLMMYRWLTNTWKDARHHSLLEMQIKSTMRYHLIPVRIAIIKSLQKINAGEGVEKREHSCTAGGNVNWYSHHVRWYGDSLQKPGIKPPYDLPIPLVGIYPEETKIEKDTCPPKLIAELFTIARTWKQLRCPSTDEWIKKLWYIYTVE